MEERKGVMKPDQEKTLDKLIKLNNKFGEAIDGLAITLVDNKGLEILKNEAEKKFPGVTEEFIYPIVDGLFEALEAISNTEE